MVCKTRQEAQKVKNADDALTAATGALEVNDQVSAIAIYASLESGLTS